LVHPYRRFCTNTTGIDTRGHPEVNDGNYPVSIIKTNEMASQQERVTITLILADGSTVNEVLGARSDYDEILRTYQVGSLRNKNGENVRYGALENGETYTLGNTVGQNYGKDYFSCVAFIENFIQFVLR
jgi:hypothetical protein